MESASSSDTESESFSDSDTDSSSEDEVALSLTIANVGVGKYRRGDNKIRREGITAFLKKKKPTVILFQEFPWKDLSKFPSKRVIKNYEYEGGKTGIAYNMNEVTVREPKHIYSLIESMKNCLLISDSEIFSRMCLRIVETKGVPTVEFICVSWHGKRKAKRAIIKDQMSDVLKVCEQISVNENLPVVIAGDFNFPYKDAVKVVKDPFVIYGYSQLRRDDGKI
jgi:endonuclease/exonuclease/phosphatase family metal-dependent hydrolase